MQNLLALLIASCMQWMGMHVHTPQELLQLTVTRNALYGLSTFLLQKSRFFATESILDLESSVSRSIHPCIYVHANRGNCEV